MRPSVVAIAVLCALGAGAYAYVSGALPASVTRPIDGALSALNGGATAPVEAAPKTRAKPRPIPVEVAVATAATPRTEIPSIGSLQADEAVSVAAEQEGRIVSIDFTEGEAVKAGDLLVKLDDSLLAAQVDDLKARLTLAEQNYERANTLSGSGAGTVRARDEARSGLIIAQAAVNLLQSRLDKTAIRAPFDGIMGLRSVSVGAFLKVGDVIATIDKIDQVKVDFSVPEKALADLSVGLPIEVAVDAYPGRVFTGEIYAIAPQIDVNGRAIRVRGRLPNPDGLLRPGLFARVTVIGEGRGSVVMVPEAAIVPRGVDHLVYRVADGTAAESKVTLGRRTGGMVEILSGVAAGDVVVTAGQTRLGKGTPVETVGPDGQPIAPTES